MCIGSMKKHQLLCWIGFWKVNFEETLKVDNIFSFNIAENAVRIEDYGLSANDLVFIKELIDGKIDIN